MPTLSPAAPLIGDPATFVEAPAWRGLDDGWRQIHGSFPKLGFSFEWHDFEARGDLDWGKSFHPDSIEICLNVTGRGTVQGSGPPAQYGDMMGGFYRQGKADLNATRRGGEKHQFLTVEYSTQFIRQHLNSSEKDLHALVRSALEGKRISGVAIPSRLSQRQSDLVNSLRHPPVFAKAQDLWYQSKALELMAEFFFQAPENQEFFCVRHQRLSSERVDRVIQILKRDLAEPPSLEKLGKEVGCSPYHLSRIFSKEKGKTIPQFLRQLRMERAAELLEQGRHNVTEAAMEVGYSSVSHFSQAFCQTIGCCPGMYPHGLRKTQRRAR